MGSDQRNSDAGSREKEEEVSGFRWFVSVAMFALSKQGVARGGPKGLGHALQMTSTSAASSAGCGSSYSQRRRRTFSRRANSLAARVQSRPRVEATESSVVSTSLNTEETNHTTANTSTRTNSKVGEKNGVGKVKTLRKPRRTQKTSKMSKEARAKRKGKDVKTRKLEEIAQKRRYRFMAVSSTFLMFGLASGATWFRFFITDYSEGGVSLVDFYGTLFCAAGAVIGMEFYARYAHRILWHDWEPGWLLHESHHLPRTGPFEANDIYAVANAVPALSLCIYGFLHSGLGPAMCWGTGLGITLYGWKYMFVHDGLVHKRFPVGPIGELPSLKRIAIAHTIHHSEKFAGVPYGLFLAEDELKQVKGGVEELDLLVERANAKEQSEKEKALSSLDG